MQRTLTKDLSGLTGKKVTVAGWVQSRRDHGGLIFIDLRDHSGIVQLVVHPEATAAFGLAESVRDEYVIRATGMLQERAEGLTNSNIETGAIELATEELQLLNRSEALPIQISSEQQASEELRLKYRYLDLRRPKMQQMLGKRSEYYRFIRQYMEQHEFVEVATPILANSSPEGARDFLVPSRVHPGAFYALPQAPQQFKQLLMVGGLPRYYQIATCFRDEDPRADRLYGDFYQLDLEMSFVEDGDEVRSTMEPLVAKLVTEFANKRLLSGEIPRLTYREAMQRYGTDKPDLRFGMELTDLGEALAGTQFGVFSSALSSGGCIKAICVKNAASLSRSQIDNFTAVAKQEGAGGLAYIMYEDGAPKSPIAKFFSDAELANIKNTLGAEDGDGIFFGAGPTSTVHRVLGRLRNEFADHFKLKDDSVVALVWIVDFPFYEYDESTKRLDFGHNPFSMPKGGGASLDDEDKTTIIADQYDLVMNGYEVCSGAVRNHNPEVMYKAFGVLGFDESYVNQRFGAMINAFKYGAPPHAGCAFGLDRMFMVLMGEHNIREVVAFPKNGSGVDVMMQSPSSVDDSQLSDLYLKVQDKE